MNLNWNENEKAIFKTRNGESWNGMGIGEWSEEWNKKSRNL